MLRLKMKHSVYLWLGQMLVFFPRNSYYTVEDKGCYASGELMPDDAARLLSRGVAEIAVD